MKMRIGLFIVITLVSLSGLGRMASTQDIFNGTKPFAIVGHIQKFVLCDDPMAATCTHNPTDLLAGAKLTVNSIEVIIPRNTIIKMPAAFLTPADIFDLAPAGTTQKSATGTCPGTVKGSGLALDDCQPPLAAFEVELAGNILNGKHIAGLVGIAQLSLSQGQGVIESIDPATGEIFVTGVTGGGTTRRIKINDATGQFGRKTSSLDVGELPLEQDGRFSGDSENPTIHASTGYPMCIPTVNLTTGDDPLCPKGNRGVTGNNFSGSPEDGNTGGNPANSVLKTFVMPKKVGESASPISSVPEAKPCNTCDPTKKAPFMAGDYINFAGTLASDAKGIYISAHTIEANVGIYTQPGADPVYMSVELVIVSAGDHRYPVGFNPPLHEVGHRGIKVEGVTTDPSSEVVVYAVDTDPVSGKEFARLLLRNLNPNIGVAGRFRGDNRPREFGISPREVVVFVERVAKKLGMNTDTIGCVQNLKEPDAVFPASAPENQRLASGVYRSPVGEFIFPENRVPGAPLIPINIQNLEFVLKGTGPLTTRGRDPKAPGAPIVGKLSPWLGWADAVILNPTVTTCQ